MASTQVPKGLGILLAIVGVPLILWDAAGTSAALDAFNATSSSNEGRTDQCMAKTAAIAPDASIRRPVCECVADKATSRGVTMENGAYDEDLLLPIIDECFRGDWD
jgi:hypothetical protein